MTNNLLSRTNELNEQINEFMSICKNHITMDQLLEADPEVIQIIACGMKIVDRAQKVCYEQAMAISDIDTKLNEITNILTKL